MYPRSSWPGTSLVEHACDASPHGLADTSESRYWLRFHGVGISPPSHEPLIGTVMST